MIITTQISRTDRANTRLLDTLCSNLKQLDMRIASPKKGEPTQKTAPSTWDQYEDELHFYDAIARSSFHIVYNEGGEIDAPQALQIMYAMLKNRSIVLTHKPMFGPSVDAFARETISLHLKQLKVCNLPGAELAELSFYLQKLPTELSYDLTQREDTLIRSRVKAHFRHLLENAKKQSPLT